MDARAAGTLVHLGVTVRGLKPLWTLAVKSILFIHACAPIAAGTGCTLVYFHITFGSWAREWGIQQVRL